MNPALDIPAGSKQEPFVAAAVPMEPASDPHVVSAILHVGPPRDHRPNPTPKPEGYDLCVVGAGVAGLLSVICAKALGKRACLIERHYMGGDCLNVGCFPSKALIRCARAVHEVKNSARFGVVLPPGEVSVDFPAIMARMRELRVGHTATNTDKHDIASQCSRKYHLVDQGRRIWSSLAYNLKRKKNYWDSVPLVFPPYTAACVFIPGRHCAPRWCREVLSRLLRRYIPGPGHLHGAQHCRGVCVTAEE